MKEIAARLDTTLPQLAIAWVLQQPAVSVALAGIRKPEEIEQNVGALDIRFSPDDLHAIDDIMSGAAGQVDAIPV
jgi:aryl-alcohol dehydrogenase-like predicted oxidoreductase